MTFIDSCLQLKGNSKTAEGYIKGHSRKVLGQLHLKGMSRESQGQLRVTLGQLKSKLQNYTTSAAQGQIMVGHE